MCRYSLLLSVRELLISLFSTIIIIRLFFYENSHNSECFTTWASTFPKAYLYAFYFPFRDDDGAFLFCLDFSIFAVNIFALVHFNPFSFRKMCCWCNWVHEKVLGACASHFLLSQAYWTVQYAVPYSLQFHQITYSVWWCQSDNSTLYVHQQQTKWVTCLENIFRDATLVHYTKNGFYDIEINLNVYAVSHPFQLQRNWLLRLILTEMTYTHETYVSEITFSKLSTVIWTRSVELRI